MRCEDVQARLADQLGDPNQEPASGEITEHLRSCPACQKEAADLLDTWRRLGGIAADEPDSQAMTARFAVALEGLDNVRAPGWAGRLGAVFTIWPGLRPVAITGLAAGIFMLGLGVGRQTVPPSIQPVDADIALLRRELHDMRQMVTLSLMQQQSASERLKGVSWSSQIDQPGSEIVTALLDTLMHDANVNVRLATIDALERFGERDTVRRGAVAALAQQTSPLVQIALIDFVVEINERAASSTLRRLSHDLTLDSAVRARAAWGLQRLG